MDKLTLILLAHTQPNAVVCDGDRDYWHARCLLKWLDTVARGGIMRSIVLDHAEAIDKMPSHRTCYSVRCEFR